MVDTIRILLVDDHAMFRDGLARMLEKETGFTVAGQANSATEGLAILPGSNANLVLLDVDLGAERALDFVKGARAGAFEGQILVLSAGMSDQEAVQLVQAGVSGILHKHHSTDVLCDNIRRIANGEVCMEPAYLAPLFRAVDRTRTPGRATLTEREGAVKASVRHVCEKLSVRTRSQLVKVALEQYKDQV